MIATLAIEPLTLAAVSGKLSYLLHFGLRFLIQHFIRDQTHHVFHLGFIQVIQNFRGGEGAIQPHTHTRFGEVTTHPLHHSTQYPQSCSRRCRIARLQHRGQQKLFLLLVKAHKGQQRQVAPMSVMTIEKRKLLFPMGGIIGGIDVEGDPLSTLLQSPLLTRQYRIG